jgi:hypothetical protein
VPAPHAGLLRHLRIRSIIVYSGLKITMDSKQSTYIVEPKKLSVFWGKIVDRSKEVGFFCEN